MSNDQPKEDQHEDQIRKCHFNEVCPDVSPKAVSSELEVHRLSVYSLTLLSGF